MFLLLSYAFILPRTLNIKGGEIFVLKYFNNTFICCVFNSMNSSKSNFYIVLIIGLLFETNFKHTTNNHFASSFESSEQVISYDYEEFSSYKIEYETILLQAPSSYDVYLYSLRCGHCNEIKNEVLSYLSSTQFYFLVDYGAYLDNKKDDNEDKNDGLTIIGTPTLLKISNREVIYSLVGKSEIIKHIRENDKINN